MPSLPLPSLGLALLLAAGTVASAHADSHRLDVPPLPKYTQECASCHMAYPPGLLPAASWQRLMGGLDKHYGTDASVDAASARELATWLNANAGTYKRVSEAPPQDRITQSAWFLRKHRPGEVPAEVWTRPAVGSPSHCVACHRGAAQGSFPERDVRFPQ